MRSKKVVPSRKAKKSKKAPPKPQLSPYRECLSCHDPFEVDLEDKHDRHRMHCVPCHNEVRHGIIPKCGTLMHGTGGGRRVIKNVGGLT